MERLAEAFPTRRISKDRLQPVICCSRFAGINFYGLVSRFLYGAPPRELPCVIDGERALENRDSNRCRQVSSALSLFSSFILRSLSLSVLYYVSELVLFNSRWIACPNIAAKVLKYFENIKYIRRRIALVNVLSFFFSSFKKISRETRYRYIVIESAIYIVRDNQRNCDYLCYSVKLN